MGVKCGVTVARICRRLWSQKRRQANMSPSPGLQSKVRTPGYALENQVFKIKWVFNASYQNRKESKHEQIAQGEATKSKNDIAIDVFLCTEPTT